MTWQVALIPQEETKAFWPRVAPLLAKAVHYADGRTDMRAIFLAVQEERQNLWIAYDDTDKVVAAAFVTHKEQYPNTALLVIDCVGGSKMAQWLHTASRVFQNCARDMGCSKVAMYGRPGWVRVLKSCGWAQKSVVLEIAAAPAAGDM